MDDYLAFAKEMVRHGGQLIKENFEKGVASERKSDNTPVTEIDKRINQTIIEAVSSKFPRHGVLGEEANLGDGSEEYQWVCDPLDGTASFILGDPHSTSILGLTRDGKVLLAAIYDPNTDRLYHAVKGEGAYCNDQPVKVSQQSLKEGYVLVEPYGYKFYPGLIKAGTRLEPAAGAGYRSVMIASGKACATLKDHFDFHDVGPASLIVEEAGGRVTDLSGRPMRFDRQTDNGIIMSNGLVHDELVTIAQASVT